MNIPVIEKPKLYLIAKPQIMWPEIDRFFADRNLIWQRDDQDIRLENHSDLIPEFAGRLCYNSFDGIGGSGMGRKTNKDYIAHILEVEHGSVLEHSNFTILFTGGGRGFTHEFVRHRHLSPSQRSTRYVDETNCRLVLPQLINQLFACVDLNTLELEDKIVETIHNDPSKVTNLIPYIKDLEQDEMLQIISKIIYFKNKFIEKARDSIKTYNYFTTLCTEVVEHAGKVPNKKKAIRGCVREILPHLIEAPIVMTGNIRAWSHFLDLRATIASETAIRIIAHTLWKQILSVKSPNCFGHYEEIKLKDKTTALHNKYKVHHRLKNIICKNLNYKQQLKLFQYINKNGFPEGIQ